MSSSSLLSVLSLLQNKAWATCGILGNSFDSGIFGGTRVRPKESGIYTLVVPSWPQA